MQADPPGETTHWAAAAMAPLVRISVSSVQHLALARAPAASDTPVQAVARPGVCPQLRDVVGLYIDPPAHAMVLRVDEKSQLQALDRAPGRVLPIKPGRCGTMTHDYRRNGTTSLFAALDVLEGEVIGRCM
jgi:hypothetical protein